MGFLEDMASEIIRSRMVIPSKDMPAVCADTAKYTDDGQPVREDQVRAVDLSLIDYVLRRVVAQVTPPHHPPVSTQPPQNNFPPAVKAQVQSAVTNPFPSPPTSLPVSSEPPAK